MILGQLVTTCKRMKVDFSLTPHTKFSSKWNNDINMRVTTLIFLKIYFWLCRAFVALTGLSLVAAQGLLIAVASLVGEHRL